MRHHVLKQLFLLIVAVLLSTAPLLAGAEESATTQYRIDHDMIEVPFDYIQHEIILHVTINEKHKLNLVLDTGATSIVLNKKLGIRGKSTGKTEFKEAEGVTSGEGILLENVTLGDDNGMVRISGTPAVITDTTQLGQILGMKVDGLFGIAAIAGYLVEIDYQKHKVRFYERNAFNITTRKPNNRTTFLLNLTNMNPLSVISVQMMRGNLHPSYDYEFLLDTGFGGYVTVASAPAIESGLMNEKTPRIETGAYSLSRKFSAHKIRAPYLKVGDVDLVGRVIQVDERNKGENGLFGIVGNRFLQNYNVVIDYLRRRIWLERMVPYDKEEPDDVEKSSFGITLRTSGETFRVGDVLPNSPAHRSGVRSGDTIVAIDGKKLSEMSRQEIVESLLSPEKETSITLMPGVDPNLGIEFQKIVVRLKPSCPLDWVGK